MIERLLAADAALERDDLDLAERLFAQVVEADERNAIAVVGLGRVAMRRGDLDDARMRMAHALALDPEEAAARRLLDELEGPPIATPEAEADAAPEAEADAEPEADAAPEAEADAEPEAEGDVEREAEADVEREAEPTLADGPAPEPSAPAPEPAAPRQRESLLQRIRRWLGLGRSTG